MLRSPQPIEVPEPGGTRWRLAGPVLLAACAVLVARPAVAAVMAPVAAPVTPAGMAPVAAPMAAAVTAPKTAPGSTATTLAAARVPILAWRLPDGTLSQVQATTAGQRKGVAAAPALAVAPGTAGAGAGATAPPLGSLWKLFVYGYLATQAADEPPYRCERAARTTDDDYCCEPGESIDRDTALQRSCGAYFAPQRLGLTAPDWQRFWSQRSAPAWLQALPDLQPATPVPVTDLLDALARVPDGARIAAREALLPNTLREPALLGALGSSPRFKTWSWFDGRGERWGGAAGWLADGSPFWFGAPGTGRSALQRHAGLLAGAWRDSGQLVAAPDAAGLQAQPCVAVRFFTRYPLAQVRRDGGAGSGAGAGAGAGAGGRSAAPGPLAPGARYTLRFANGQTMAIPGQAALRLGGPPGAPRLQATLPLEDYVARVIDREADAGQTEAARALAIAARSWLRQNAAVSPADRGCVAVDDDSRAQRVSPRPPTAAARAVAAFTAGLVLEGAPVGYRLDADGPQLLSWRRAVAGGQAGQGFESLLREAFPAAVLAGWQQGGDCEPLPLAATWLAERQLRWHRLLRTEPGWEPLESPPQVCLLNQGKPHADLRRGRIYLREWTTRDGRVTLIHEYLHLALRRHPNGSDEAYVERLAQRLADEVGSGARGAARHGAQP